MTGAYLDWDDYLYPTAPELADNPFAPRVLRNIPGITDHYELLQFELDHSLIRGAQITTGEIPIAHTFDADHLAAIHHALFQDVYEWAGQWRAVPMAKHRPPHTREDPWSIELETFAPPHTIPDGLDFIAAEIRNTPWESLDQHGAAAALSQSHTQLTYVHPFREGNGRTARIFLEHLAQDAGYTISPYPDKHEYLTAVVEANRGRQQTLTALYEQRLTPNTTHPTTTPTAHAQGPQHLHHALTPTSHMSQSRNSQLHLG